MSDFLIVRGFEEIWRPPVRPRRPRPEAVLSAGGDVRARLTRIVRGAPEVMVKVTGRTRDGAHLRAHLDYIARHGALALEDQDGQRLEGRRELREIAEDWRGLASLDPRRRANTPLSHSIVLSMPAGTDPLALRDAARAFAAAAFGERHEYVMALHTDTPRPHVHLAVRSLGLSGKRLHPKRADLEAWRQLFAEALRERGVEAEATPRRARGVSRKADRTPLRKMADRHASGRGAVARTVRAAYQAAADGAFVGRPDLHVWEQQMIDRQARVRALYLAQARILAASSSAADRTLGVEVERFVREMPAPDSRRLALARELREANAREAEKVGPRRNPVGGSGRDRSRDRS